MHRHDEERIRHLHGFVNSFVIRSKRERYHAFLSNSKRRSEILNRLNHYCATDFDLRYRVDTPPSFSAKLRAYILAETVDTFLADFPSVSRDQVDALLEATTDLVVESGLNADSH